MYDKTHYNKKKKERKKETSQKKKKKPSERSQFPCGPSINVSACPTRPVSTESHILPFPDSPQARQGICLVCFKEAPGFPPTQVNSEKLV